MKLHSLLLIFFTLLIHSLSAQLSSVEATALTIGKVLSFDSEILDENRTLNIYLPYGYHADSAKTYPVIYLLDGSMDEDFIHVSGIVQFGSFSWIQMLPESIVVGIGNVDRKRDYTFHTHNMQDKEDFPTTGGSASFIRFLAEEVEPLIKKTYHTSASSTIIGQSLGGLLATEILLKSPDMFDNYIIVSPSLWWDDGSLLEVDPASYDSQKSIYVAVGDEGEIMIKNAKDLHHKLTEIKKDNTKLYFKFLKEQNHGDALHLAVYDAFLNIYSHLIDR